MNEATSKAPVACDDAEVSIIVEGRFSEAGAAIGKANLPTLQRAAQDCNVAAITARGRGEPDAQFKERAQLCRARIRILTEAAKASF